MSKKRLVISFLLGIAIGFLILGIYEQFKIIKPIYLEKVIKMESQNTYKNVYLDIIHEPMLFAEYKNDSNKFYIVQDNDYMYIAYLNNKVYDEIINSKEISKSFKITGHTKEISDDIKKIAIDAYNEIIEKRVITLENFESYFGNVYIDATNYYTREKLCYTIAVIFVLIALIIIYEKPNNKKRRSKNVNK